MGCICSLPLVATLLVESAYALNIELEERLEFSKFFDKGIGRAFSGFSTNLYYNL